MTIRRCAVALFAGALLALVVGAAQAQQAWPSRPVRIIVPFPGGGSTMDTVMRLVAPELSKILGQQVIIDNKPGAGTVIGVDAAAKSNDGHTFVGVANSFTVNQTLVKDLPYNMARDLQPVLLVARTPNVLAARAGLPPNTLAEFVAYAKKNPGKLSYASFGNGTTPHFAGEMFKMMAGIDMAHIPYKGQGPALTDLLAGNVDVMFGNLPDFIAHIKAGKLKAYGTTYLGRAGQAPDIPTVAEQGYAGFETDSWYGLLAPAGVPRDVVDRVNTAVNRVLSETPVGGMLTERGLEVLGGSSAKFGQHLQSEIAKYARIVKDANMRVD
jgi:tripartite-type tricarboxylate transporter receptor subunit TctC